jgi:hypothetical protein
LSLSESEHAGIVGVIHEILDGVRPGRAAGIPSGRTTERRGLFGRCVANTIASLAASALERMKETQPVTYFMSTGVSQVVGNCVTSGQRREKADNAIPTRV